jgi:hypothetical protein
MDAASHGSAREGVRDDAPAVRAARDLPGAQTSKGLDAHGQASLISADRRAALVKLGGCCACCGLGMEFAPVLEIHHVNFNGDLHRQVMKALHIGAVTWVLEATNPSAGLFAVEVLCSGCHRMTHEAGRCPHRWKRRRKAAARTV